MVSDTLFAAICQIDAYLDRMPKVYEGERRQRVLSVRDHMEEVLKYLDTPPGTEAEHLFENETRK